MPYLPFQILLSGSRVFSKKEYGIRCMWAINIKLLQLLQKGKESGKWGPISLRIDVFIVFLIVLTNSDQNQDKMEGSILAQGLGI